jgi:hypothetical protein
MNTAQGIRAGPFSEAPTIHSIQIDWEGADMQQIAESAEQ